MKLTFLGGAGTVTGSKYLLEHGGRRVLIDCGLFQGLKQLRLRNWREFPLPPASLDAIVLTHAHLDHSGFVPRLAKLGFAGSVICTPATRDLAELLLIDSARLQEEEADYANRHGFSKHHPALPLYTDDDAQRALALFAPQAFGREFEPIPGVTMQLRRAGHLLGAAGVHVKWPGGSLLCSGDLGRDDDLVMPPPEPPLAADFVLIESTYGDRAHRRGDVLAELADVIDRTAARGGIVIVPSFAVGRAQALLLCLHELKKQRRIPDIPIFLNSPMAADATGIYQAHRFEHRLNAEQREALGRVAKIVHSVEESRRLNALRWPAVIVSASGMATGGRVVHHLKAYVSDARNTVLFTGYQPAGTRGAALLAGAQTIKIHGEYLPVRAEIVNLDLLSAHADRDGLLAWLAKLPQAPREVYVTHGEPTAADSLRLAIEEKFHWTCTVPEHGETAELGRAAPRAGYRTNS
jgi:metallo-beta-lactamase family protein